MDKKIIEKFWKLVNKTNQCWLWQGYLEKSGYGRFQKMYTHRISWMIHHHIDSIPDKMCVCHTCDNPSCVNPSHLFLGTQSENMKDMSTKGRAIGKSGPKGESNSKAILTESDVTEIRNSCPDLRDLAKKYKVTVETICNVLARRTWKHVG